MGSWAQIQNILELYAAKQVLIPGQLEVTLTGHSLGGALATICALFLDQWIETAEHDEQRRADFRALRAHNLTFSKQH